MSTYKNTTASVVDAYRGYYADQKTLADYFHQKAKEFGFTEAEILSYKFDRTVMSGFTSLASPDKRFWKNLAPGKYSSPVWAPRTSLPKGVTGGGLAAELKGIRARWTDMVNQCPVGKNGKLDFDSVLQAMGFNNWLSFFCVGGVTMFLSSDRSAVFFSIGNPPESWDPAKFGWQEVLGSEYNVEKAKLELAKAEAEAKQEAVS